MLPFAESKKNAAGRSAPYKNCSLFIQGMKCYDTLG